MSQRILRVGVIGAGIGQMHIRALLRRQQEAGDVQLIGVCDADPTKWEVVRGLYEEVGLDLPEQSGFFHNDYRDMCGVARPDAVTVALPNFLHEEVSCWALENGLHVLCEKPMSNTLEGAVRMAEIANGHPDLTAMMVTNNLIRPEFAILKDCVVGEPIIVRAWWLRRKGIPFRGFWFTDKAKSGGGPGIDLAPHLLSLVLGVLDWPDVGQVLGWTATYPRDDGSGDGPYGGGKVNPDGLHDVEDWMKLVFTATCGDGLKVPVEVEAAWAMHVPRETMGLEVVGSEATVRLERTWPINDGDDRLSSDSLRIFGTEQLGDRWVTADIDLSPDQDPTNRDPWMGRLAYTNHFVDCVLGKAEPICGFERGLKIQRIISAAYASAAEGGAVAI